MIAKKSVDQEAEESCADVIHRITSHESGIVGVQLDTEQGRVAVDYDRKVATEAQASHVVGLMKEPIRRRHETCSLRVGRQGGRACESCAGVVERRLQATPGIRSAGVSFRAGILTVTYDQAVTTPEQIRTHVEQLGIAPVRPGEAPAPASFAGRGRLWLTRERTELVFTVITFVAMAAGLLADRAEAMPLIVTICYTVAYLAGGAFGLKGGIETLRHGAIDIDLLMILAALGAVVVGAPFEGAMLLFLFSLSNVLQDHAMGRTRSAIKELMKLRPNTALIRRDGELVTRRIEDVSVGDTMLVKPGDRVPLDGVVMTGESAVDQSSVTGESMPVSKGAGDSVFAGTINQHGALEVRVNRLAKDSTIAKLIRMVEEAQSAKAKTQRFIDRAEQYYALGVVLFTVLAIAVPMLLLQEDFQTSFYRAMTLLVAASPCALVISTPATILSAIGNGARRGILFKGGAHVEQAAVIKVIAFDKTGTLTQGKPRVTDVQVAQEASRWWQGDERALLRLAAAVQAKSEHVLARATVEAAQEWGLDVPDVSSFGSVVGKGVRGVVEGREIHIGNLRYYADLRDLSLGGFEDEVAALQEEGKTCVVVASREIDGIRALGLLAFADVLRTGVANVVRDLERLGVEHVVMLTGDNERVARRIASEAGIKEFYAELLPEDKMRLLKELERRYGSVAMVGDGVNDAPALAQAALGIAMGAAGSDVALETADVVLMGDDLKNIPYLISLSHKTRRTLAANLGFAFTMILLMVGVILVSSLPLPLAVIGHEGSTVLVSLNGLRLLAFRPKERLKQR